MSLSRIERPKSPVATWRPRRTYCSGSGLSRLNSARIAVRASGCFCMPSMICTDRPALPGVMRNVINETTIRTSGNLDQTGWSEVPPHGLSGSRCFTGGAPKGRRGVPPGSRCFRSRRRSHIGSPLRPSPLRSGEISLPGPPAPRNRVRRSRYSCGVGSKPFQVLGESGCCWRLQ